MSEKESPQFVPPEVKEETEEDVTKQSRETKDLSPEIVEHIMSKVQDIDTPGTAYTMLDKSVAFPRNELVKENLQNLLRDGLLGTITEAEGFALDRDITRDKWVKNVRKQDQGLVFFNIVGRGKAFPVSPETGGLEINKAIGERLRKDMIIMLFDVSSFREEEPARQEETFEQKHKTYRLDDPNLVPWYQSWKKGEISTEELQRQEIMNNQGEFLSDVQYGFVLSFRVAPRLFKGIVLREKSGQQSDSEARVAEVVATMREIYQGKEKLLVPIYDSEGNLLWPKKMSYAEVKESTTPQSA
ncbi:hypothetical protein ACFL0Z_00675 [Patescibacteria group bacterium]